MHIDSVVLKALYLKNYDFYGDDKNMINAIWSWIQQIHLEDNFEGHFMSGIVQLNKWQVEKIWIS